MIPPRRRGVCPSLAAPMPTGDGLLARITPTGTTIPLDAAAALCAAARRHGSGIIEITARGSIQVRGLTAATAPIFAQEVEAAGIATAEGVPVVVDPLAGLVDGAGDAVPMLAAGLRRAILAAGLAGRLAPKVSVALDGGGALHLDGLPADVRLRAEIGPSGPHWRVSLGGDAAGAALVGAVAPDAAVATTVRLLTALAARGPKARAREIIAAEGAAPFRAVVADLLLGEGGGSSGRADDDRQAPPLPAPAPRAEPIGLHRLRNGMAALGVGLAFGHTDADRLAHLIAAARTAQADGVRTAPDRALLIIGLRPQDAGALAGAAAGLGFVTAAGDPRRSIAACPGAPLCACTETPTRALAPAVAAAVGSMLDGSLAVHLSGCVKGCAQPGAAPLTIVGGPEGCGIVVDGAAGARPLATVPLEALTDALAQIARAVADARQPDEHAAAALTRLGPARLARILAETAHG